LVLQQVGSYLGYTGRGVDAHGGHSKTDNWLEGEQFLTDHRDKFVLFDVLAIAPDQDVR